MNSKAFLVKALSMCLSIAILATYTSVALATPGKAIGDITVLDTSINGDIPSVKIDGEIAQNGRTIFANNTITTPENAGAIVNLGKFGRLELAPNTAITFSNTGNEPAGNLVSGKVTSLTETSVSITTINGQSAKLGLGKSVKANASGQDDDDDDDGGSAWLIYTAIFAGAGAALLIAAFSDNNRVALGGGTTVASPNR